MRKKARNRKRFAAGRNAGGINSITSVTIRLSAAQPLHLIPNPQAAKAEPHRLSPSARCQARHPPWLSYPITCKPLGQVHAQMYKCKYECNEKTNVTRCVKSADLLSCGVWVAGVQDFNVQSLKLRAASPSHLTNQLHSTALSPHTNYALWPSISGC